MHGLQVILLMLPLQCNHYIGHSPPSGISLLAEKCTRLVHLDLCGCLSISNRSVYALQESVLHMREPGLRQFTLLVGGQAHVPRLIPRLTFAESEWNGFA